MRAILVWKGRCWHTVVSYGRLFAVALSLNFAATWRSDKVHPYDPSGDGTALQVAYPCFGPTSHRTHTVPKQIK